jgi:hypothetical protein
MADSRVDKVCSDFAHVRINCIPRVGHVVCFWGPFFSGGFCSSAASPFAPRPESEPRKHNWVWIFAV